MLVCSVDGRLPSRIFEFISAVVWASSGRNPNRAMPNTPQADRNLPPFRWWLKAILFAIVSVIVVLLLNSCSEKASTKDKAGSERITNSLVSSPFADTNGMSAMEAAQSVVVTHDLQVAPGATLADALRSVERHFQPDDGAGRTFAILEAFNGEIQSDGRMRVSLRVSTEKPGLAAITYKPTGDSLWKSRITPVSRKPAFPAGSLTIYFESADGKSFTVDGSLNPPTVLDAMLKEAGLPVTQLWADGEVRKLKFIYSACGCPIEVKCRREGDRTVRTEAASQVIFPDDPAALQVISRLMRW